MRLDIFVSQVPYIVGMLKDICNYSGFRYTFAFWAYIVHYVLNRLKDICNSSDLSYILHLIFFID